MTSARWKLATVGVAKWLLLCACVFSAYPLFVVTFYIPGGDLAERAMHTAILWAVTAAFALASGFLFQLHRTEKPRLWRTPPMVLLAVFTFLLLVGIAGGGF